MPNWVKNKVRAKNDDDIKELIKMLVCKDIKGNDCTNFNGIIPIPEELRNTEHSSSAESQKKMAKNKKKYGYESWYDFSCAKWGCKWDCNPVTIVNNSVIEFESPWSIPIGIYEEISKTIPLVVAYADEDIGRNCGICEFDNGVGYSVDIIGTEIQLANAIWGNEYDAENDGEYECYKEENFSDEVTNEVNKIIYE